MAKNSFLKHIKAKIREYWQLTKPLQTGLLLSTGLAGYMSARCPISHTTTLLSVAGSLFLTISGSTILNMWWDRDIDSKMGRTKKRATASGLIHPNEALRVGLLLAVIGTGWAFLMNWLYGVIVLAGLFFDVVVYSMWLKRRTCWSIVWGGISGAMPILAGRTLGVGAIDWIGLTLALGIILWIPTHILTFSIKYHDDYRKASIPTFPSTYGSNKTRVIIAISCVLAAVAMGIAGWGIGVTVGYMRILVVLSIGLLSLAVATLLHPTEKVNFGLFKYASLYMLLSMLILAI